jgi:hypothetical protein
VSIMRWTVGLALVAWCAVPAVAQTSMQAAFNYNLAEEETAAKPAEEPAAEAHSSGCADEPSCEAEASCGCESGCCSTGCNSWGLGDCLGDCCLGEPWLLKDWATPNCCDGPNYGGWIAAGYYNNNDRLSTQPNDLKSFNDNPDNLNLDQAWLYVEKLAESDGCNAGWGYRADIVYGVDAQKTQAFGNPGGRWDTTFDNGSYGWAIPQAYGEVAYGDWSVKFGKFFTIVGYEVIPATGNFFYSHSYTMFNSEPFTHTGVLGTYKASETLTVYTGWTAGWDTGFDQFNGGSNFLGGFGIQAADEVKYTYICTAGNLGFVGQGYSHSNVVDFTLSSNWHYVLQSDFLTTNQEVTNTAFDRQDVGVNQYLFYTLNDCWAVGGRAEWWKSNSVTGFADSYQGITGGVNYKATANLIVRPEIKYNWTNESTNNDTDGFNSTMFAVDAILTF